mmetsp:Transcript_6084/g.6807  ORF Transcript_6084/g.6807 Transcript_6084/m.6807 type:complete len:125 (-) Transcript_6084:600-974(-)
MKTSEFIELSNQNDAILENQKVLAEQLNVLLQQQKSILEANKAIVKHQQQLFSRLDNDATFATQHEQIGEVTPPRDNTQTNEACLVDQQEQQQKNGDSTPPRENTESSATTSAPMQLTNRKRKI